MLSGLKDFLMRGNIVDLAVAVVIGAAFGKVVDGLVSDIITPIIAAIGGQPDFNNLTFTINDSVFRYGHFLNQIISFIIVGSAVYFLVVKPMQAVMARMKKPEEAGPSDEERRHQELLAALKERG